MLELSASGRDKKMPATTQAGNAEALIANLDPMLRPLAQRGAIRSYKKNSVVINEGDVGESLFILLQGRVKVYATDDNGREITYGNIDAGDYFGEMSLDGGTRSASVITLEPSICSVVTRSSVRDHLTVAPDFAMELVTQVIRRARSATETARQMALLAVYGRVISTLENEEGPGRPRAGPQGPRPRRGTRGAGRAGPHPRAGAPAGRRSRPCRRPARGRRPPP